LGLAYHPGPRFSGLAWALIFGLFASTIFTLVIVPVAYYALNEKRKSKIITA